MDTYLKVFIFFLALTFLASSKNKLLLLLLLTHCNFDSLLLRAAMFSFLIFSILSRISRSRPTELSQEDALFDLLARDRKEK
jgi:hypothetical protein